MLSKLIIHNLVMPSVSLSETCKMRLYMSCNVVRQLNQRQPVGDSTPPDLGELSRDARLSYESVDDALYLKCVHTCYASCFMARKVHLDIENLDI